MIIEFIVSNSNLEKFYNNDLTLAELLSCSWNSGIFKVDKNFKTIRIEIPKMEEK